MPRSKSGVDFMAARAWGVRVYGPDGKPREACNGWYSNEPMEKADAEDLAAHYNRFNSNSALHVGCTFKAEQEIFPDDSLTQEDRA